jgi:hypothetical protein
VDAHNGCVKRTLRGPLALIAVLLASLNGLAINIVPAEKTVAERIATMDAVLRLRALGEPSVRAEDQRPSLQESNPDIVFPYALLLPAIEQDVDVLEVIKGHAFAAVGGRIRIRTSGGHNGMHMESDWRRRTLSPASTYVLFLSHDPRSTQLRYYHYDMFRLDDDRVTMPTAAPYGEALQTMKARRCARRHS